MVGRYHADFEKFSGRIEYNPRRQQIVAVRLIIEAESLRSAIPRFDRIVASEMLLNTAKYPQILFESDRIEAAGDGYLVTGKLTLHGVSRVVTFPFQVLPGTEAGHPAFKAAGRWIINRKEFGIIWNPVLDKGGILVGNHITVDWQVRIP